MDGVERLHAHLNSNSNVTSNSSITFPAAELPSTETSTTLHPTSSDLVNINGRRRRESTESTASTRNIIHPPRKKSRFDLEDITAGIMAGSMNGSGGVETESNSHQAGPSSGLLANINKVNHDSEYMYPSITQSKIILNGDDVETKSKDKGKGKERDVGLEENGLSALAGNAMKMAVNETGLVRREDFVRVVLQALKDVGYDQTASVLEAESGYVHEPPLISAFKAAILGGRWTESIRLLEQLGVIHEGDKSRLRRSSSSASMKVNGNSTLSPVGTSLGSSSAPVGSPLTGLEFNGLENTVDRKPSSESMTIDNDETSSVSIAANRINGNGNINGNINKGKDTLGKQALFMILQQKYLELLEANQTKRALSVLRHDLQPLAVGTARLHALSGYIMCMYKEELYTRTGWDGAAGTSRETLLENLQSFLEPGLMIPPRRLATLFDQSRRYQELHCMYHTESSAVPSLLADHRCRRLAFPSVSTHVLAEHEDEVWVVAWSHCGQYLASGGKDPYVIIWKIGPSPALKITKHMTLKLTTRDVMSIAWSPDDTRLLIATEANMALYDTKTGAPIHSMAGNHKDAISTVRFLPGRDGFISAGMDMKIMIWGWEANAISTWQITPLRSYDFVVVPETRRIVSISMLNEIKHDVAGAKAVASRSPERQGNPPSAASNPNSPYAFGKMDREIIIYDQDTGSILCRRRVAVELTSISLSADSKHVLISCLPDEMQLWSIEDDDLVLRRKYTGHQQKEYHLKSCFGGKDGNYVVTGSEDGHIYVWHNETAALLEVLEGHNQNVNAVSWNPVYPEIFASCSDDGTLRIWQPPSVADLLNSHVSSSDLEPTSKPWTNGTSLPTIAPISPMPADLRMDLVF